MKKEHSRISYVLLVTTNLELNAKFWSDWKETFETRAHFSSCMCLIDVTKGKLVTPNVNRSPHLTKQYFETLATLYEIMREFLGVFHGKIGDLQKWNWQGGNKVLKWISSSEGTSRCLTSWTLLEKILKVEISYLYILCGVSRFWLQYTGTQKLSRVWHHRENGGVRPRVPGRRSQTNN